MQFSPNINERYISALRNHLQSKSLKGEFDRKRINILNLFSLFTLPDIPFFKLNRFFKDEKVVNLLCEIKKSGKIMKIKRNKKFYYIYFKGELNVKIIFLTRSLDGTAIRVENLCGISIKRPNN